MTQEYCIECHCTGQVRKQLCVAELTKFNLCVNQAGGGIERQALYHDIHLLERTLRSFAQPAGAPSAEHPISSHLPWMLPVLLQACPAKAVAYCFSLPTVCIPGVTSLLAVFPMFAPTTLRTCYRYIKLRAVVVRPALHLRHAEKVSVVALGMALLDERHP